MRAIMGIMKTAQTKKAIPFECFFVEQNIFGDGFKLKFHQIDKSFLNKIDDELIIVPTACTKKYCSS